MREAGARHTPPPPPCPCSRVRDLQCGRPRAVRLGALALITVTFATAYLCQVVAPGFVDPALGEWVRGGWLVPNPKRCYCSKRKAELTEPKNAYQRLRAHRAPPRVNHRTPPPPPPPPPAHAAAAQCAPLAVFPAAPFLASPCPFPPHLPTHPAVQLCMVFTVVGVALVQWLLLKHTLPRLLWPCAAGMLAGACMVIVPTGEGGGSAARADHAGGLCMYGGAAAWRQGANPRRRVVAAVARHDATCQHRCESAKLGWGRLPPAPSAWSWAGRRRGHRRVAGVAGLWPVGVVDGQHSGVLRHAAGFAPPGLHQPAAAGAHTRGGGPRVQRGGSGTCVCARGLPVCCPCKGPAK